MSPSCRNWVTTLYDSCVSYRATIQSGTNKWDHDCGMNAMRLLLITRNTVGDVAWRVLFNNLMSCTVVLQRRSNCHIYYEFWLRICTKKNGVLEAEDDSLNKHRCLVVSTYLYGRCTHVSQKTASFYFFNNFVKASYISIIFGIRIL